MRNRREREAARDMGTYAALAALIFIGGGLLALVAVVLPKVAWLVVVVLGFALMGLLQYVIWGRWLSHDAVEEEDE